MAKLKSFLSGCRPWLIGLAYAGPVVVFLWVCGQFYLPGKGFTYLIEFGERLNSQFLPAVRAINHYELPDSGGYDAQYYAQIAMDPRLGDPKLAQAVDNLPYRARRILFCWTAYALAGGDPVRALQIYAVQNIVSWLLLAALLLRWFPPHDLGNWVRWAGTLFCFGLCACVRGSLVDGPSLLLIAAGMALLESGRGWLAAAVFAVNGLGRETNLLAAPALAPAVRDGRAWRRAAAQALVVALPLAAWMFFLWRAFGGAPAAGTRNFAAPFLGYFDKCREIARVAKGQSDSLLWGALAVHAALTAQWLFFALRRRASDPWWRLGAAYATLMVFLGDAVWEGYPGAAARVLLPMTLAFNVLMPRGRGWWAVLLIGNLSVLAAPDALSLPGRESYVTEGPRALRIVPGSGRIVEALFDARWYAPEKSWLEYWRWSRGAASVVVHNPHPFAVTAEVSFGLRAKDRRSVSLSEGPRLLWCEVLLPERRIPVRVPGIVLEPGDTVLTFSTDRPAVIPGNGDPRLLAFSIRNLKLRLSAAGPPD